MSLAQRDPLTELESDVAISFCPFFTLIRIRSAILLLVFFRIPPFGPILTFEGLGEYCGDLLFNGCISESLLSEATLAFEELSLCWDLVFLPLEPCFFLFGPGWFVALSDE
uniref:Mez1 n=1 Tax=Arundo donax TaxID=35708 RepID=A0A0A9CG53_ARUDO